MQANPKAIVAMSGGVDSSVAAGLLQADGYEVIGLFLDTGVEVAGGSGGGETAVERVRGVAEQLGIHVDILSRRDSFERDVIRPFAAEYARARTPNPCVVCNAEFKLANLIAHADDVGADVAATGHYARVVTHEGRAALARGANAQKDQSYYLFRIGRSMLSRLRLPVGEMTKTQVRDRARALGLAIDEGLESQDVCFAGQDAYVELVRRWHPEALRTGRVLDVTGEVIGEHAGLANYTIGQRRGLGIAMGQPVYVAGIDRKQNTVTLGPREALLQRRLAASDAAWLVDPPAGPFRATAQIRYRHREATATVTPTSPGAVEVVFDEPQWAITPGQAVVFYDGGVVLGGAWIDTGYA